MLLKDFGPTTANGPQNLTAVGTSVYFTAADANGRELWRSDGTPVGTGPVRDIRPGSAASTPAQLTAVGGLLYFTADDGENGRELWRSDGTGAGTAMVKDINPGAATNDGTPIGTGNPALKDVKLRQGTLRERARAAKGVSPLSNKTSAFDDFDRMSSKIDAVEAAESLGDELDGRSAASAEWTAWSSAVSRSPAATPASSGRSASMTAALAGAPRPWPPKPSATARSRAPAYTESSLA